MCTSITTKEGVQVKVGQLWRDLDKRMKNRIRKVKSVNPLTGKAVMVHPSLPQYPQTTLSISRMHNGSTGWKLVSETV